ncbi:MAG: fibronectin type III domain-containing protein [Bacteroidaceae bacterium]|nr:fibronectin type III domain-containing protein [Bacteroidaceae bacterium]
MKKLFLLFTVLCAAVAVQAQVISAYTAQVSQGTYTEITGGFAVDTVGLYDEYDASVKSVAWNPAGLFEETTTAAGFEIGFDFEFNDVLCNQFFISPFGYIVLGRDEVTLDPSHGNYIAGRDENADNVIGVLPRGWRGCTQLSTTEISYKLEGESPNRTLVVQYKDLGVAAGWEYSVSWNFQIRLNEGTNTIDFVLGEAGKIYLEEPGEGEERTDDFEAQVEYLLKGSGTDVLVVAKDDETGDWMTYPEDRSDYWTNETAAGTTFTFTAPADCVTPEEYVRLKEVIPSTDQFRIEWNPLEDADRVLLILSESYMLTEGPQDGTFYKIGDELGGGIVLDFTTDTVYDTNDQWELTFKPATEYYLHAYTANTYCAGGPMYDTGILGSFKTKPEAAVALDVTNTTINTLTIDVTANETNNVMVVISDSLRLNAPYPSVREFGRPIGQYNVGDMIDGVGRVVYMGPSAQNVVVEGLEASTIYFVRAISYDAEYNYATLYAEDAASTVNTLPWTASNIHNFYAELPAGWEFEGSWSVNSDTQYEEGVPVSNYNKFVCTPSKSADGTVSILSFGRFLINQRDAALFFDYNMFVNKAFWQGGPSVYEWVEGDTLALQVRREGGEWENGLLYTYTNYEKPDSTTQIMTAELDLNNYVEETVEIRLYWRTFGDKLKMTLDSLRAEGRPIPVVPEVKVSEITWNSALVTWRGEQESFEFAYAKTGDEFTTQVVTGKEVALTDLTHLTEYQVKVRGIVAENDYSDWSEVVTFTTADLPACPVPTGLAHANTEDYGDKLTWELNEEHLSWDLRYRKGDATSWIDVEGLETNEYTLYELEAGAAYVWRVRAYCDMDRVSEYASQETFNANGKSAISAATADRFTVAATNGAVTVYNSGVFVESVALVDMQGRVLGSYEVNACDNITVPANMNGVALVVVKTLNNQFVYKVNVK